MSTDRELLELAARAFWREEIDDVCSVRWLEEDQAIGYTHGENQDHNGLDRELVWNPLEDDGDLYRLARAVKGNLYFSGRRGFFEIPSDSEAPAITEHFEIGNCEEEARAIVRAAAEIGRAMP